MQVQQAAKASKAIRKRLKLKTKTRKRLKPRKGQIKRRAGVKSGDTAQSTLANSLTPETLAYALPGGLAKLVYPDWIYGPHLKYVENRILQILRGEPIKIMVSMPPRHGKTQFLSKVLPAFFLGRFPDKRVMLITHTENFSRKQSRAARNIINAYGKEVFDISISKDTAAAGEWDIAGYEGGMEAIGAGGSVMGKGADLLLMDDIVKGIDMASNVQLMEDQWEWFITDVYSRLEPGASVIIIMTRWTTYDIIGCIEQRKKEDPDGPFKEWETINFPALATGKDPLGRSKGEPLFPQRISKKMLLNIKGTQDDLWYEAMYQGNPVPAKGNIINSEWFKKYKDVPDRSKVEMVVVSADTASKDTEISDFTAIGVWYIYEGRYYLVDLVREKLTYPEILREIKGLCAIHTADFCLIEDKGSGTHLIQDLQESEGTEDDINVIPIDPGNESKVIRLQAETPTLRSGKVYLPEESSWVDNFALELRAFPKGKKDQADMLSQFLRFMRQDSQGIDMW